MVNRTQRAARRVVEAKSWKEYLDPFQVTATTHLTAERPGMGWVSEAMVSLDGPWSRDALLRGRRGEEIPAREAVGVCCEIARVWVKTRVEDGDVRVSVEGTWMRHPVWERTRTVEAAAAGALIAAGAGTEQCALFIPEQLALQHVGGGWKGAGLAAELGLEAVEGGFEGAGGAWVLEVLYRVAAAGLLSR